MDEEYMAHVHKVHTVAVSTTEKLAVFHQARTVEELKGHLGSWCSNAQHSQWCWTEKSI